MINSSSEAESSVGVVAANPPAAARIGAAALEAGGNAMDAAVAAAMACCMLRPDQTGVGGYVCAAVVLDAASDRAWSVDANAVAPAAASDAMFELMPIDHSMLGQINEGEYACSVRDNANVHGPLAVAVPGMMAGMGIVHERWGRLPWAAVVEPSIALLEDGFPFGDVADAVRASAPSLRRYRATTEHLMPDGRPPERDDIWHRPDMGTTLRRVAREGWRDFYSGETGRAVADHLRTLGGVVTREDMARFEPRVTTPLCTTYHGARVFAPILPNGALTTLQVSNMLEWLDLPAQDTPHYWHLLAEVLKLAWRDRLACLADPDFADVPVERLLDKQYAAGRVETLRRCPEQVDRCVPDAEPAPPHGTLHVSTADAAGNAVAMTISQGGGFGSHVAVPGTGIILGHGMCRLDPRPGRANSIAPGKRPLNNVAPLVVRHGGRDIAMGLPGGRRIISVMPRAAQLMIDRHTRPAEVVTTPRLHLEGAEPVRVTQSVGRATIDALTAMGHRVEPQESIGGCMNIAETRRRERVARAGSGVSAVGA